MTTINDLITYLIIIMSKLIRLLLVCLVYAKREPIELD